MMHKKKETTSWEKVSGWYDQSVGSTGHYYHEKIILPKVLSLLNLKKDSTNSLLDLACGQGILSRLLPPSLHYLGLDISPSLIESATKQNVRKNTQFQIADITKKLSILKKDFDFCTILLAIQNLQYPLSALKNAFAHLAPGGKLLIVMNHPCFRIPKHSSWGVDTQNLIQYRRMDRYYSPLKIPIQSHPSKGKHSAETLSFHHPLSQWSHWLKEAGFFIESIEEWCSDKKSTGKYAEMEDISRGEFPLFLCLVAYKGF